MLDRLLAEVFSKTGTRTVASKQGTRRWEVIMDIEEEFDALGLRPEKKALAWEARAKITWGDPGDDVQSWLAANGIEHFTAERIVAIAVGERTRAIRAKGVRDLVLGILACVASAGVGIGTVTIARNGIAGVNIPIRALLAIYAGCSFAFMYGSHLTWRGLARTIGGARVKGAVSDVGD